MYWRILVVELSTTAGNLKSQRARSHRIPFGTVGLQADMGSFDSALRMTVEVRMRMRISEAQ